MSIKYIKTFEHFQQNQKINGFDIEVLDANANNNDGGVQIDTITIMVNGDEEYVFEVGTAISGDIYVTYMDGGGDFEEHFGLSEGEQMKSEHDSEKPNDSYLELRNFLSVNDNSCIGDSTEIDGFEIEITDFSNEGGMEFGYLEVTINGEDFQLDMEQDATGSGLHTKASFQNEEDELKAKEMGFDIESDEVQGYLFDRYDRICNEHR